MPLSIRNPRAEQLAREVAALSKENLTQAIIRALEERLRKMFDRNGCTPVKKRPTTSDYNTELYKVEVFDKITMKQVDSMAAIGNDAAHNNPDLKKDQVERFKNDLLSFLQKA